MKFVDIGVNLTDPVFKGVYRGKQAHRDDFVDMLKRAASRGMERMIVTGGSLEDSRQALEVAKEHDCLYSTAGCHPTRCSEPDSHPEGPDSYFKSIHSLIKEANGSGSRKIVAVGEFGLDYDRLQFCPVEQQKKNFEKQFDIAEATGLPLFLHCRNTGTDFADITRRNRHRFREGVVHSFSGTAEEAAALLDMGLYIGINGCSLKTEENLQVVKNIPLERIMFETDAPWCDIRNTHASKKYVKTDFVSKKKERFEEGCMVKGRNEPATIVQVAEVVAGVKEIENLEEMCDVVYRNTMQVFFPDN
eukprot:Nk52_evm3s1762 gene=Nk52_evmTU3s1762